LFGLYQLTFETQVKPMQIEVIQFINKSYTIIVPIYNY